MCSVGYNGGQGLPVQGRDAPLAPALLRGPPKSPQSSQAGAAAPCQAPGPDLLRAQPWQQGMVPCAILEGHVVLPVVTLIFPRARDLPHGQELLIPLLPGPLSPLGLRDTAEPRPGNGAGTLGCQGHRLWELRASPFPPGWGNPAPQQP